MDVMNVVTIAPQDLFPDEKLLRSVGTNVLLARYPNVGSADGKPWVIGASAPEKVLGVLHLTNYRLIFKPVEQPTPVFSIFLPAIVDIKNVSWLFVRKFRITIKDGTYIEFVMWGIRPFIKIANKARMQAATLDWQKINVDIAAAEGKSGEWHVA